MEICTLSDPAGATDDSFGRGIARIGDLDRDGSDEILVGAYLDDAAVTTLFADGVARRDLKLRFSLPIRVVA